MSWYLLCNLCTILYIVNFVYNKNTIFNKYVICIFSKFTEGLACQFFSLIISWQENQSFQISGWQTAYLSFQMSAAQITLLREILHWHSGVCADCGTCTEY